ncbi:ArsR family transcriptional regulator [Campylobacter hepaticus]|uniref:ArsR family transcriptional regulator n=1 Tax=Campylobacter hepaticus TaxID=1813019 RepID=A0A424Z1P3_9BACT|nr:metalloregulator ArsR/SmtB family transcription factor [Campylobacter hepaticus]RQD68299.1 ArsR family transcriptional regulator [Campylobacter hepaticus]RQD88119.1 ArsR family transcriptional regulator [Campylobacter hepaticus]
MDFESISIIFKALSDVNRLKIVSLLSEGEKCACVLLDNFQFKQSTLSYHMKFLVESKIIYARSEGKWMYYSLNKDNLNVIIDTLKSFNKE